LSYTPTGEWYIRKLLQYVEETTFGTTPSSPAFTQAGVVQDITANVNIPETLYRQLGSRDPYKDVKYGEAYDIQIKYMPVDAVMLKYGVNLAAGAGTVGKSLSLLISQDINTTENYVLFTGARTNTIDIEITETGPVMVTQSIKMKNMSTPSSAHGLTTPTFAGAIAAAPWTNINGGSLPLTINALTYDCARFKISVGTNLDTVQPIGETILKFLEPTIRTISVDFDMYVKDTATLADTKALTARTATYSLDTGSTTVINMTNLQLNKYSSTDSATSANIKKASFSGQCTSVSITP
jgi:hypothetical protein